jgi:ornithine carbamoyltransferase
VRKDLLSIADIDSADINSLIHDAIDLKERGWLSWLNHMVLAIMFEKPSLRTRVSFEMAMRQLGGQTLYLSPAEVGLGSREPAADVARVLSRYVDAIAIRTFAHQTAVDMAEYSRVPVINALSDREHPCQALADLLTIYEHKGGFSGLTLAYIGDGNNVANSLMLAGALVGIHFHIAAPPGYAVPVDIQALAEGYATTSGAGIVCLEDPGEAATGADVIYTDVWTSMGQEAEAEERHRVFAAYQVNDNLLSLARPDAIFMHPLPAHHGEEVAKGILDSPRSVVFDQAENRLHIQKALLARMLGGLEVMLDDGRH